MFTGESRRWSLTIVSLGEVFDLGVMIRIENLAKHVLHQKINNGAKNVRFLLIVQVRLTTQCRVWRTSSLFRRVKLALILIFLLTSTRRNMRGQ